MLGTVLFVTYLFSNGHGAPKKEPHLTGHIHDFLVKYIDDNISPCDNFYNHVCPRNVKLVDLPANRVFPKDFLNLINQRRKLNRLEIDLAKNESSASYFYSGLRIHLDIVEYVNEKYPDPVPIDSPLREKLTILAQTIVQQIQKSVPYLNQNTTDLLVHQALRTNYYTGWTNFDYLSLGKYYDHLNEQYEKLLKQTSAQAALAFMGDSIAWIENLDPALYAIIQMATYDNSEYMPSSGIPLLFNTYYLISLGEDAAVQHGSTFMVAAHEMHHSVFNILQDVFKNDSKVLEHWKCLANHNKKVSKIYHDEVGDPDPNTPEHQSSMATFNDDGPDLEGLHASYTMIRDVLKLDLEHKPYTDLPLTRSQLFFYAYAAMNCDLPKNQTHTNPEPHSSLFARVNGPLSLMKAFIDTFQCGPETRMGKLYHDAPAGKCNQVGDAIKKV